MIGFLGVWWVWMALAIVLGLIELLTPGFIFLGFAVGAAATGLLLLTPIDLGLPVLLVVFAALSLTAWLLLRRLFKPADDQTRIIHEDVNK